jgi:penicillin amidase
MWRWLRWTLVVIVACAAAGVAFAWWAVRQSLPRIDGVVAGPGLSAQATIARDARGVPVITATHRADLAYATGYAHAQDRFFQMDLSRRLAAGELAELFGKAALPMDRRTRRFGFRGVARRVMEAAPAHERAIIEAYARGVNAGLSALESRPWEYLPLRAVPADWLPEDSVLVVHSMWWQLQYGTLRDELVRRRLERAASLRADAEQVQALIRYVYAGHSDWDTPNYSKDARCASRACSGAPVVPTPAFPALLEFQGAMDPDEGETPKPGSNSWAVAGIHTRSGVALIANDMHLDLGVPAVWYPARLRVTGADAMDVTGVTLPGTPAVAAGSNGRIAWGFTNSYGDFTDARWGRCVDPAYSVRRERFRIKGGDDVEVVYRDAGAGVVLDGEDYEDDVSSGDCLQAAWLATRPEATNFALLGLEQARSVDEALALAPGIGIPGQNMVVGDAGGRIAWTLLGRVPRDSGPDRLFGPLEYRDANDHPAIADPPVGRLWTANQRVVAGSLEAVLGDDEVDVGAGGYDVGARARQIRDRLLGLTHPATEADMLSIQLDARALFLARWRNLLLDLLDEEAMRDSPSRREFRDSVSNWQAEAAPESVGYRLVRVFRSNTLGVLWHSLSTGLLGADFAGRRPGQFEAGGFRLVNERPSSVVPPGGGDWRQFLLARVDATIEESLEDCASLAHCEYGDLEPVRIRHPLSRALPILSAWLDMPTRRLPGDHHMPRVQAGEFGASERFAVSPGRESEGYLAVPGGPSGHPMSPFYRSGFEEWAEGKPTPFLPGPVAHELTLRAEARTNRR